MRNPVRALADMRSAPLHVRALGLYVTYSFIMSVGTVSGLQLALPLIMEDFDVPVTTAVWVSIAYFVALSGATVALGGFSTFFDRRTLVVVGIVVDIALMLVIFVTPNIYVFIVCRFLSAAFRIFPWLILQVIGVGGFPPDQRGKAVGYNALVSGVALLLALPFTGFMLDNFGWRWLFMVTSVAFALLVPVVYLLLPSLPPESADRKRLRDFDLLGSALMVTGVVSLLTSLQLFARGLSSGGLAFALGGIGIASLVAFVWVEMHAKSPILKFSLFKIPGVSLASTQAVVMGFTNGAFLLMLPFYFITGLGWSAAHSSNMLLFQNLTRPPAAPLAGRFSDRWGSAAVILPAAVISVIGQVGLAMIGVEPVIAILIGLLLLWGTGQALMQTSNLRQFYAALPRDQLHLAPSVNLTVSTLGSTSGQAFGSLAVEKAQLAGATGSVFVAHMSDSMLIVTGVFVVGMIATQILPRVFLRSQIAAGEATAAAAVAAGQPGTGQASDEGSPARK